MNATISIPTISAALPPVTWVQRTPRLLLRLEGLTVLIAAAALYYHLHAPGLLFAALLLAPDLSALGYLVNARVGAFTYNAAHTHIAPFALAAAALAFNLPGLLPVALIWWAHIGMDRFAGYGLKYALGFNNTHMGRTGRAKAQTAQPATTETA